MHRLIKPLVVLAGGALLLGGACAPAGKMGGARDSAKTNVRSDDSATLTSGAAEGDQPKIARLEREARAIAKTTGCHSASACRTAPVGARSCGGPRTYLVYCAATTDTVALFRKLRELETAEKAYNEKSGLMSTCEMRIAPRTVLEAGSCRQAAP